MNYIFTTGGVYVKEKVGPFEISIALKRQRSDIGCFQHTTVSL